MQCVATVGPTARGAPLGQEPASDTSYTTLQFTSVIALFVMYLDRPTPATSSGGAPEVYPASRTLAANRRASPVYDARSSMPFFRLPWNRG